MKKLSLFFRKTVFLSFFCALTITGIFALTQLDFKEDLFLTVEINPTVVARMKLYFDTGNGFTEEQNVRNTITDTDEFQTARFALPKNDISRLRLDPLLKPGRFLIRKIKVVDRFGKEIDEIPIASFTMARHMQLFKKDKDTWVGITTPNAFDPQLIVEDTTVLRKAIKNYDRKRVKFILVDNSRLLFQLFGTFWLIGIAAFELRCWFLKE